MRLLLIGLCIWVGIQPITAAEPYLRPYGPRDGLPNIQVFDLHGGRNDLLYLGTSDGLYQFNGIRFTKIPMAALPTSVSYISESTDGVLWCKDFSNRLFYYQLDSLREFKLPSSIKKQGNLVNYHVADSMLYLASRTELIRLNMRSLKQERLIFSPDAYHNILDFKVSETHLAVAINGMVQIFALAGFRKIMEHPMPLTNTELSTADGLFYVAYRGVHPQPAYEINPNNRHIETLGYLPPRVHSNFIRIWQNKIHWCTNQGVFTYDRTTRKFQLSFLKNKRISDLMTDKRGNHWVSSLDHSIYLYPYANLTYLWPLEANSDRITSIASFGNNKLLAGTNQGNIVEIDQDGRKKELLQSKKFDQIQFISIDEEKGLVHFTHGTYDLTRNRLLIDQFLGKSGAFDKLGNVAYVAGELTSIRGPDLLQFPIAQKSKIVKRRWGPELIIRKHRARKVFYSSKNGFYLVGFTDQLRAFSVLGEAFDIQDSIGGPLLVNDIMEHPLGSLWLGTIDRGLWQLQADRKAVPLNCKDKLSGDHIKKMVADPAGFVWVLTENGLDLYNPNTRAFSSYQQLLGLSNLFIFDMCRMGDWLVIASDVGLLKLPFRPDLKSRAPKLKVTKTLVNGKPWVLGTGPIPYNFKTFKVEYLPIHFQSEGQVQLQYRLEGEDENWNTLSAASGQLSIYGLPSGTHMLEMRLQANNQISNVYRMMLNVNYPFWSKWWFIGALTIFVIGVTTLLSRAYNQRRSKNRQLQEQLAASQLTAMKAQMNPHFLYNVLNSIQGLIYANKKEEAADYLSKFSELMRLTLNFSDRQWHEISEEISALELYLQLEAGRFGSDFSYEVRFDAETRQQNPEVPSMLIQPYVENAIKHGLLHKQGPKRLSVDFSLNPQLKRIIITIEDNGIGRKQGTVLAEKRRKHRSFATHSLNNRIEILNQLLQESVEIEIIDKQNDQSQATGTLVMIKLPFKNN